MEQRNEVEFRRLVSACYKSVSALISHMMTVRMKLGKDEDRLRNSLKIVHFLLAEREKEDE